MNFFYALSVDPFLGKIDKHSFSQQTLMELLIEGIIHKEKICGSKENPLDISKWMGLKFNDCNDITQIDWSFMGLEGSIDLKWLPPTTKNVFLLFTQLTGSVDLTCLPEGFEVLNLRGSLFGGPVDLTNLPSTMKELYLSGNDFRGMTDFTCLPESLQVLDVSITMLEGEIRSFDGDLYREDSNVQDMRKN